MTGATSAAGSLLQAAVEVARLAGDEAMSHFRQRLRVERKTDGSER